MQGAALTSQNFFKRHISPLKSFNFEQQAKVLTLVLQHNLGCVPEDVGVEKSEKLTLSRLDTRNFLRLCDANKHNAL